MFFGIIMHQSFIFGCKCQVADLTFGKRTFFNNVRMKFNLHFIGPLDNIQLYPDLGLVALSFVVSLDTSRISSYVADATPVNCGIFTMLLLHNVQM